MCSLHSFEKSVLLAATKDSSAWALESKTGDILNNAAVHPKKTVYRFVHPIVGYQIIFSYLFIIYN
ncbi:hypothetical protein HanRHA438_Chr07g0305551 [Helianthus annuus]|nr:hypothetical protein HanIR_Chr07g0318611 [Helianthus annuus]KAJ0908002.1 hypothetical protein HanRHA438_Chr07g0305551 [Helianthus annuus]